MLIFMMMMSYFYIIFSKEAQFSKMNIGKITISIQFKTKFKNNRINFCKYNKSTKYIISSSTSAAFRHPLLGETDLPHKMGIGKWGGDLEKLSVVINNITACALEKCLSAILCDDAHLADSSWKTTF